MPSKKLTSILFVAMLVVLLFLTFEDKPIDADTSTSANRMVFGQASANHDDINSPLPNTRLEASQFTSLPSSSKSTQKVPAITAKTLFELTTLNPIDENLESFRHSIDAANNSSNILYASNFNSLENDWHSEGDIWRNGSPVYGPHDLCGTTSTCLATVLDDDYPDNTNAKLSSPDIFLPELSSDEMVLLRFSNWFDIDNNDLIKVSISTYYNDGVWSEPDTLSIQSGEQTEWQDYELDLSPYNGDRIRLNFELLQSKDTPGTGAGWMINDIKIIQAKRRTSTNAGEENEQI